MKKALVAATVAMLMVGSQLAAAAKPAAAATPAVSQEEIDLLKAQLKALQDRLAQLEQANSAQDAKLDQAAKQVAAQVAVNDEQQLAIDNASDNLARTVGESASSGWLGRWVWKGDFRYRNENIDQEFTTRARNRDRMRLRLGAVARVNDDTKVEVQLTTGESGDARSPNQTLTDVNSRKSVYLDTAFVEWAPNDFVKLQAGKMRYPWVRTSSYFYDGDVNPEGVAGFWQQGTNGFFGSAFVTRLTERSAYADSNMVGAQFGYRNTAVDGTRVLLAAGYFDQGAVKGYNNVQAGGAGGYFGNSTTTSAGICRTPVTGAGVACLANDFNVLEVLGEYQTKFAGQPLLLFFDYVRNNDATYSFASINPTANIRSGLDTAEAIGVTLGRASGTIPGSWEVGYIWQKIEKDSIFGQWVDSDFAGGNTDASGSALRGAYQISKNWRFNFTYFLNKTNIDVATAVTYPTARNVFDRDYKRLQLDLNWTF